jgi:hypothetical protein
MHEMALNKELLAMDMGYLVHSTKMATHRLSLLANVQFMRLLMTNFYAK